MKTTSKTKRDFPKPFRFAIYLFAVIVFCFLNWVTTYAGDPETEKAQTLESRLAAVLVLEADPEPELEDWMLSFNDEVLAEFEDEEAVPEAWMLDPAYFVIPDYLIVEKEEEPVLEDWMLDPGYYVIETLLIAKSDW